MTASHFDRNLRDAIRSRPRVRDTPRRPSIFIRTLVFVGWYQGHPLVTAVPPAFLGDPFLFSWWELRGRDYEGDMRLARCFLRRLLSATLRQSLCECQRSGTDDSSIEVLVVVKNCVNLEHTHAHLGRYGSH